MNQTEPIQVFISYAREDYHIAKRLYEDFKVHGIKPWLDKEDLLVGQNWHIAIDQAIKKSNFFCALLSSKSVSKIGYVQKELKKALNILDNYPSSDIYLLPVRINDCEPLDEKLLNIHWTDLFPSYTAGLQKILRVIVPNYQYKKINTDATDNKIYNVKFTKNTINNEEFSSSGYKYLLRKEGLVIAEKGSFTEIIYFSNDSSFKYPKKYDHNQYVNNEYINIINEYVANGNGTVSDCATGLMWQISGAKKKLTYADAHNYVKQQNQTLFAGFNKWRLPTLDELASLIEVNDNDSYTNTQPNGLYINTIFNKKYDLCWSSDKTLDGKAWYLNYYSGGIECTEDYRDNYVRLVRDL